MRLSRSLTPNGGNLISVHYSASFIQTEMFLDRKKGGGVDQNQRNLIVDIFLLELLLELKEFPSERGNPSVGNSKKVSVNPCFDI